MTNQIRLQADVHTIGSHLLRILQFVTVKTNPAAAALLLLLLKEYLCFCTDTPGLS